MTDVWVKGPVLGIETTGRLSGVAVFADGRLVAESTLDARALRQEVLLAQVDSVCRALGLGPRELTRIGVAIGPGSFTGVRVGLASARALAVGADLPLVGVPSHQALAWPFRDLEATLVLLTGLRRGEVFLEAGRWERAAWVARLPGATVPVGEVRSRLAPLVDAGPLVFLGEAVDLPAMAAEIEGMGVRIVEPLAATRRPGVIACLAARTIAPQVREPDLDTVEPLYLRPADARRPGAPRG